MKNKIKLMIRKTINNKFCFKFFGESETKNILKDCSNKNQVYKNYYMRL